MFQYDMLARSLALGDGFRWYAPSDLAQIAPYLHLNMTELSLDPRGMLTTFRAPLYPAFLSIIYIFNGINDGRFFAARLAQALLGASLAPMTYLAALRIPVLALPERQDSARSDLEYQRPAQLAAIAVTFYPMLVIFPLALATENLFFVLVLASILALLELARVPASHSFGLGLLSGFLLALAALTRSVILPFAALAVLWIWFWLKKRSAALAVVVALSVTVAPWIIRNSRLAHRLTGIETSMGYNLYVGYHPMSTGTFTFGPSLDLLSILDDQQRDQLGAQQAMAFVRDDPARFPYLAVRRLGYFFNLELRAFTYFYVNDFLGPIPSSVLAIILIVLTLPFVLLALSAALGWFLLGEGPVQVLLLFLILGYLLPHVFILSEERFHLTLIPILAVPAAAFWTRGLSALRARPAWMRGISLLLAGLLLLNWGLELSRDSSALLAMLAPGGNLLYLPY